MAIRSSDKSRILSKMNGVSFNFDFTLDPQVFDMFLGFYELDIRNTLLRFLRKGSVFIDIGANIGFISALGAGLVGKSGEVHSFEPVPYYFRRLSDMAKMNNDYQIFVNNFALGEKYEKIDINITNYENIGWNTMVPGMMRANTIKETIKVDVKRIDDYILENEINNISLIKIDVEGFEFPVLKGLTKFFEECRRSLPPIVVEIAYSAYPNLGVKLGDLEDFIRSYSYEIYSINGKHKVDIKTFEITTDVILIHS
ncbi:MAG: FkbM family methyltransferase [Promethearchaeota archaeon]